MNQPPDLVLPQRQDPVLTPLTHCTACGGPLGSLRVHEGSSGIEKRGKIVQTCRSCHNSYHHTPAYVYEDAQHLISRLEARQFRRAIPADVANAPLRFAPVPLPAPPEGRIFCNYPGCKTQGGGPRSGARKCIEYLCRTCCHAAANAARRNGAYRDSCKTHGTQASTGPIDAAAAPQIPFPVPPPPPPPQPQRAPDLPRPEPSSAPTQAASGRIGGRGMRGLAQPMSQTWVDKRAADNLNIESSKVVRQKLALTLDQTVLLIIYHTEDAEPIQLNFSVPTYPQTSLSHHPSLMDGLKLTPTSWFDVYAHSIWTTISATTPFVVDKHHPTILRLRPSLLSSLPLSHCPGIDDFISQQPRKRTGSALVSPPKKSARTDSTPTTSSSLSIAKSPAGVPSPLPAHFVPYPTPAAPSAPPMLPGIEIATAPAVHPTIPPPIHLNLTDDEAELADDGSKLWPDAFYLYEHQAAWDTYDRTKDRLGKKTSIEKMFPNIFPNTKYRRTTVGEWHRFYNESPREVRDLYASFGRTPLGTWRSFVAGVRKHRAGEPLPAPPTSVNQIPSHPPAPSPPRIAPVKSTSSILPAPLNLTATTSAPISNQHPVPKFGLCICCDAPLTTAPSPKLLQLRGKIFAASEPSPTATNPEHRHVSATLAAMYCKQHKTDTRLLPTARQERWPLYINYADLMLRVADIGDTLTDIVDFVEESEFFGRRGEESIITGYFGKLGQQSISTAVRHQFPSSKFTSQLLSYDELVDNILVPEAMTTLISSDFGVSYDAAVKILTDSTAFGLAFHSDVDDRDRDAAHFRDSTPAPNPPVHAATFPLTPEPTQARGPSSSAPDQIRVPFPALSPLSSPLLTPKLTLAEWDNEEHLPVPPPPDPTSLCHYCDQPLPDSQSAELVTMGKNLYSVSWPDPLPENSFHRTLPTITMAGAFCRRHQCELDEVPRALAAGWPMHPSFSRLFRRILDLGHPLRSFLAKNWEKSHFFQSARDYYGTQVTQLSSVKSRYANNRQAEGSAGYYGERGYAILDVTLRFMFPATDDFSQFSPLTYDIILHEILIPEAAMRFIQEDLGISADAAVAALRDSHSFGLILHPSNDCPFYNSALRIIAASHRRQEWSYRIYKASGAELDFETWLHNQMNKEEAAAIKAEPSEPLVPGGTNFIDLTGEDDE